MFILYCLFIGNIYNKGPFTNDVRREGEGGGWPISDQRKGGCVDLVLTRGREGVQNPDNLADVICERPLNKHYGIISLSLGFHDVRMKALQRKHGL